MRIHLHTDYRGKPSKEQFYPAGVYDDTQMPIELMDYLIVNNRATLQVIPNTRKVDIEPTNATSTSVDTASKSALKRK